MKFTETAMFRYTSAVKNRTFLVTAAALAVAACVASDSSKPTPRAHLTGQPGRVVLLSLDGLAAVRHRENLRRGLYSDPEGLAAFEAGGYVVEHAIPVDPPLTSVSHASIASGAFPSTTGIVSNAFHVPHAPLFQGVSGFETPWGAESLWQAFRRQGRRVGVLTFPGCDATSPSRTADFGMFYVNRPNAPAALVTLAATRFTAATLPPGWTSFSPARRTTITVPLVGEGAPAAVTFTLTALDDTDDGITDYDTLVVDDDEDPATGTRARVHSGEWFPLSVRIPHRDGGVRTVGAWCLLQALPPDLAGVRLYRGAFFSTEAYPREFRELLEEKAGFWPGPADERSLARTLAGEDGLGVADILAQTRRFSEFFDACAAAAIARERFDLLMLYQPVVDEVEHGMLVVDPRQREYSEGLAATGRAAVDEVYRVADHAVGRLARELDLSRDALVVVSDHGMAPVWETVDLNQLLQQAGLAEAEQIVRVGRDAKVWRVKASSRMAAYASGGCAHLYVNLKGREEGGVVEPGEARAVVGAAAAYLAGAQVDGQDVVEAMFRREDLARIGLDTPNAGDLVVFLRPGFNGSSQIRAPGAPFHAQAEMYGQHGFLNSHTEMAAVWLARGAGVPAGRASEASLTGVAVFVAELAGVQPPAQAHR